MWSYLPTEALGVAETRSYECLYCNAEVTAITRREAVNDGWVLYGPGKSGSEELALCDQCAPMMRTLQAIRSSREYSGDITGP